MAETTQQDTTEQAEKPAPKKRTAKKAAAPKPPTLDQALEQITAALADPNSPEAAQVNEALEQLAAATGDAKPTNVYTAILAVMRDVRAVGKHGRNEDQGYAFRGIDDVINALGPAMRRHGLLMFPKVLNKTVDRWVRQTDQRGNQKFSTAIQVKVRYRFLFAPGGKDDYEDVVLVGESIDTSDKATAKAMSVALRTALLQTFALPTYDTDPDQHNPEIETPQPIPAEELRDACRRANTYEDLDVGYSELRAHYGDARINVSEAPNRDGVLLAGPAYLDYAKAAAAEHRAQQIRAQQDKAAEGPEAPAETPTPAADNDPAPLTKEEVTKAATKASEALDFMAAFEDAYEQLGEERLRALRMTTGDQRDVDGVEWLTWARETVRAQREQDAREQERHAVGVRAHGEQIVQAARAQEQARAQANDQAREQSAPSQSKEDALLAKFREELEFQAETLGHSDVTAYAAEAFNSDGSLSKVKAPKFLIAQRPAVIDRLRENGTANVAEAYASLGNGCPIVMDVLWEKVEKEDRAHSAQPQQQ